VGVLLAFGAVGCGSADPWPKEPGKLKVLASFPPLASFAKAVGGDDVVVLSLMATKGPHDFEGTPSDALKVRGANVFLVNGLGLDEVVCKRLQRACGNPNVKIVELGTIIDKEHLKKAPEHDESAHEGHAGHHHHGEHDPHVWLSPLFAAEMVVKLGEVLKEADPAHGDAYVRRAGEQAAKLVQLHNDGKDLLRDKKDRKLVTFHESLGYFGDAFGLEVAGVIEKWPGTEPSPVFLSKLADACKEKSVRVIAVEPQFPTNTAAKALLTKLKADGIDAEFAEVDPLETASEADISAGWYDARMRANLAALAKAMK
jgi:ABC-type Zn uptake system ZnuABC Zn-binding protein ZnuA